MHARTMMVDCILAEELHIITAQIPSLFQLSGLFGVILLLCCWICYRSTCCRYRASHYSSLFVVHCTWNPDSYGLLQGSFFGVDLNAQAVCYHGA